MTAITTIVLFIGSVLLVAALRLVYAFYMTDIQTKKILEFLYERKATLDELLSLPSPEDHAMAILSFKNPRDLYSDYIQDCWGLIQSRK